MNSVLAVYDKREQRQSFRSHIIVKIKEAGHDVVEAGDADTALKKVSSRKKPFTAVVFFHGAFTQMDLRTLIQALAKTGKPCKYRFLLHSPADEDWATIAPSLSIEFVMPQAMGYETILNVLLPLLKD